MVVCKFFEQGTCKFGQNCRFEHPSRAQSNNRFAAFGSNSGGGFNRGGNDAIPYLLSKETIEKDLTSEAPQWILSAYGPGRDAPEQLFGGPMREQSFEEMRLHHVMAVASGNPQAALNQAQELYQQAQLQMKTAIGNLDGAIQFIISAEQKHPNRIDICKQGTQPGGTTGEFAVGRRTGGSSLGQQNPFSSNASSSSANPFSSGGQQASAFGSGAAATGSAFGQASALGQKPNPFGAPAFGQPAQPAASGSAFGQPSQPTSAFGQPAQTTSAFGQPSQPTSAFGAGAQSQTSAFGKPAQTTSAFGQPSALGLTTSAFGQASALGAKPNPFGAPAFGQPAQPAASGSAFGQASALGQKPNPFGAGASGPSPFSGAGGANTNASPFGQAAQNNATPSPFGQPAQNAAANPNPFGAPAQQTQSAFGQPAQPAANSPFGQPAQAAAPSGFGQPAQPAAPNPFGQPAQPAAANNPFGAKPDAQPSTGMDAQPTSAFGQPAAAPAAQANPFGGQPKPSPFGQPSALGAQANPFGGQPAAQPAAPAAQQAPASGTGPYPPGCAKQHPPVQSTKGMDGRLATWKGKPVAYKDNLPGIRAFNGSWARIWFPDGPPNYYKDTELPDGAYNDAARGQWMAFVGTGRFEGGIMPEVPPKREFCLWDM
ncbi:Nucleoporin AMO1 [Colletotrichum plurivorum]|uniref:Nucleoporin AMO1 n=1 Tax=Colletotrichum plurivorum TaxID=2175906 RepID=A0A8H6NEW7_9PEZI|nr:Nucleoporin AMO1 [Colletotrichum plurivorum]